MEQLGIEPALIWDIGTEGYKIDPGFSIFRVLFLLWLVLLYISVSLSAFVLPTFSELAAHCVQRSLPGLLCRECEYTNGPSKDRSVIVQPVPQDATKLHGNPAKVKGLQVCILTSFSPGTIVWVPRYCTSQYFGDLERKPGLMTTSRKKPPHDCLISFNFYLSDYKDQV